MKHTTSVILAFLLATTITACVQPTKPPAGDSTRPLAAEGEFCGGIAAFQCAAGLTCRYDGTYPDAGGTCVSE